MSRMFEHHIRGSDTKVVLQPCGHTFVILPQTVLEPDLRPFARAHVCVCVCVCVRACASAASLTHSFSHALSLFSNAPAVCAEAQCSGWNMCMTHNAWPWILWRVCANGSPVVRPRACCGCMC